MGKALDLDLRGVFISPLARFLLTDIVCDQPRVRPHRYPRFPDIMGELEKQLLPLFARRRREEVSPTQARHEVNRLIEKQGRWERMQRLPSGPKKNPWKGIFVQGGLPS
ncbi:MAG: hypothetical protein DMG24_04375 [Acidobacteria bacterium]|nr:MAG: hypothetical protein DMG24_04375 [Acidobacteriota bacterium]